MGSDGEELEEGKKVKTSDRTKPKPKQVTRKAPCGCVVWTIWW